LLLPVARTSCLAMAFSRWLRRLSTVVSLLQARCQTQCSRTLISEADRLDEFGEDLLVLPSVVVSNQKKTGSRL
jgi:hypothetical protein